MCTLITLPVFPLIPCFNIFIVSGTALSRTGLGVGKVDNHLFDYGAYLLAIFLTPLVTGVTKMNKQTPVHKMFNLEGRHTQKQPTEQKPNYNQKVSVEE